MEVSSGQGIYISTSIREIEVKCNYKNKFIDLKCKFCNSQKDDNQYHLLQCDYLIKNCRNLSDNITIDYEDIFDNLEKQIPAAKLLHEVLKIRAKLNE